MTEAHEVRVTYSIPHSHNSTHVCASLDEALAYAARKCGVTERTIRRRYNSRPSEAYDVQVGGREIGDHGCWISE